MCAWPTASAQPTGMPSSPSAMYVRRPASERPDQRDERGEHDGRPAEGEDVERQDREWPHQDRHERRVEVVRRSSRVAPREIERLAGVQPDGRVVVGPHIDEGIRGQVKPQHPRAEHAPDDRQDHDERCREPVQPDPKRVPDTAAPDERTEWCRHATAGRGVGSDVGSAGMPAIPPPVASSRAEPFDGRDRREDREAREPQHRQGQRRGHRQRPRSVRPSRPTPRGPRQATSRRASGIAM